MSFCIKEFLNNQKSNGKSVIEISRMSGVGGTSIWRIMQGRMNPELRTIQKLVKPLDIGLNFK